MTSYDDHIPDLDQRLESLQKKLSQVDGELSSMREQVNQKRGGRKDTVMRKKRSRLVRYHAPAGIRSIIIETNDKHQTLVWLDNYPRPVNLGRGTRLPALLRALTGSAGDEPGPPADDPPGWVPPDVDQLVPAKPADQLVAEIEAKVKSPFSEDSLRTYIWMFRKACKKVDVDPDIIHTLPGAYGVALRADGQVIDRSQ